MSGEKRELPPGAVDKLKALIGELEAQERDKSRAAPGGEIELKVNIDEALWYVAYKTTAEQ